MSAAESPRIALARLFAGLDSATVAAIASRAGVAPRQISNLIVGQPIAAVAFLRLCCMMAHDPLPSIPHPFVKPGTLDFDFFALAFRLRRRLNKHTMANAATIMEIGKATVLRIERGDHLSIGVVLKTCKYLGQHPFGFFAKGTVSREQTKESNTSRSESLPAAVG